jgi:arginyl-tRNA synthetase
MADLIPALQNALRDAVRRMLPEPAGADALEVPVLRVPDDKPGDYGSPIAFGLAKTLRRNPAQIAAELAATVVPPEGVARIEAVGPYLNAYVDPGAFVRAVVTAPLDLPPSGRKVVIEHTSVNPNKEAHVGHLRNIVLGDAVARIERAAGHRVEVQNYIDDTGRQAAESLFAVRYFGETPPEDEKYDHWLGRLYVRLGEAKERDPETIDRGVAEVMHQLERGELRHEVERIVRAQLETYHALGAEYDLLVWSPTSSPPLPAARPRGARAAADRDAADRGEVRRRAGDGRLRVPPGLEEPQVVLVRSGGNAMYVAKDIGYHLWKVGRLAGMAYRAFDRQPSGHTLWTTHPDGAAEVEGHDFGHAQQAVNVIDVRQAHPQAIVRAALELTARRRRGRE